MRKFRSVLALLLALTMVLSCFTGFASAEEETEPIAEQTNGSSAKDKGALSEEFKQTNSYRYADDEIVRAIVVLKTAPEADVAGSPEKKAAHRIALLGEHQRVLRAMSSIPYEMGYEFTALLNGFSCDVPYGDLESIAEIDGVDAVYIANSYAPPTPEEPQTESSGQMMGNYISNQSGYNGEGIVVAVLDTGLRTTHEAFQVYPGMPITETVTEADITKAAVSGKYISAKIPFAYDYVDGDNDVSDTDGHGTHVAGIAVGYAESEDGAVLMSGAAPAAQLLFMKIFNDDGEGTTTDIYLRALEDAYRLGADVVNMSFGSQNGFTYDSKVESNLIGNAYKHMETAGIVLSVSAGNSYSMNKYSSVGYTGPEYAGYGVVGAPSTYEGNVSVASVENTMYPDYFIELGGQKITLVDSCTDGEHGWIQNFGGKTVEIYVLKNEDGSDLLTGGNGVGNINGTNAVNHYKDIDVRGKVVVISRGDIPFEDKVQYAAEAGAIGVIVCNYEPGRMGMSISTYEIPAVLVTVDAHALFLAAEEGATIYISETKSILNNPDAWKMSHFSSWGTSPMLTIDPTITGVGGNVYSSVIDGDSSYDINSGTSMAAPNVAGTFACVLQALAADGNSLAMDKYTRSMCAKALLESTGIILTDADGYIYSVRKQGAGLANSANAIATYANAAYIVNPIQELGDDKAKTGVYTMELNLLNEGSGAVTYDNFGTYILYDRVEYNSEFGTTVNTLTSDYIYFDDQGDATVSYTVGGREVTSITLNKGEELTVTVTITLNDEIKEILDSTFENGTYIEGYVSFSQTAAENEGTIPTCDINADTYETHATFLAFYGDWTQGPALESIDSFDYLEALYLFNTYKNEEGKTYAQLGYTVDDLMYSLYGAWYTNINKAYVIDANDFGFSVGNGSYLGANPLDQDTTAFMPEHISFSPFKFDGFLSSNKALSLAPSLIRNARYIVMTVADADTGEIYQIKDSAYVPKNFYNSKTSCWESLSNFYWNGTKANGKTYVPSGTVATVTFDVQLPYGEAEDLWQENVWSFDVTVDTTDPVIESAIYYEASKTLKVTARDEQYLAGIYLVPKNYSGNYAKAYMKEPFSSNVKGKSFTASFDVSGLDIENIAVAAMDYATNETYTKEIRVVEKAPDYSGTCGGNLKWGISKDTGLLRISGTGSMTNWTIESSVPWSNYRHYIKAVEICSGVTSIGDYAFARCSNLTEVDIPDGVTSIGDHAFECTYLTEVDIPNSVTSIGDYAFGNCSDLTEVTIGTGVTSIGEGAFIECYNLSVVTIPDSVETIGKFAFMLCEGLTVVTIGKRVASIGLSAFAYCFSLSKVNYTGTEKMWKAMAIEDGNDALFNAEIYYGPYYSGTCGNNLRWELYGTTGCLYISGTGPMTDWTSRNPAPWDTYRSDIRTVEISSGVTSIGTCAFQECSNLTNVDIPNSVTFIDDYAFEFCDGLANVVVPNSVTSIGARTFYHCSDLARVTIGSGVETIEFGAFKDCSSLTKVYYKGTKDMWSAITIGGSNNELLNAEIEYTVAAQVTGHTVVIDPAVEATCTTDGLTEGAHCSVCDMVLVKQETIPAIGHTEVRIAAVAATCTAAGKTLGSYCSACNVVLRAQTTIPATGHSYTSKVTTSATCTNAGVKTFTCSKCNHCYIEAIAASGHTEVVDKAVAATCTTAGKTEGSHCSVCNAVIKAQTTVAATGHSYTYKATKNPTTSATGTLTGTCSKCSGTTTVTLPKLNTTDYTKTVTKEPTCTATGTDTYLWNTKTYGTFSFTATTPALGHNYTAVVTAPTCTARGYTTHTCTRCANSYKDSYTGAIGHNYIYVVGMKPTTSAIGRLDGACSNCSGITAVILPALNTTDYTKAVTKAPTCTETGIVNYVWNTTTYGTFSFAATTPALGHSYTDQVTAPTCTARGYTTHTCTRCANSYKDSFTGAIGHNYTYVVGMKPTTSVIGRLDGTCSNCSGITSVILPALNTADYTKAVTKAPTCTETGIVNYVWNTTTYGTFSFAATTPELGHSYTDQVTAPTCTAQGYTTHTCSRCSDSYKDTYTNATGHSYTSKVTTAATCANAGVKTFTCSKCSHSYTEAIAATGHAEVVDKAVAATCTTAGKTEGSHCSVCNAVIKAQTTIPATGHSYTSKVTTAATCTTAGVKTFTCFKCAHSYTEAIAATGHTEVVDKAVAATCTTAGKTEGSHCSVCNTVIKAQTTIPATGHSYTSKVTTAATCTKDGVKTFTCSKCSHSYTETIAATGHTEVKDAAVAATCTTAGKTEGSHCSVCNTVIKAQTTVPATGHSYTSKVTTAATCTKAGVKTFTCSKCSHSYTEAIAATGHTEVVDKAVAATCTTAGKTEGSHCSVCNAVIKAQTTVAVTGHSYTYKATKNPTTSATGTLTGTCSMCSGTTTVNLPKLNTTDYTKTVTKAPTCTATGTDTYKWKTTTYGTFSFTATTAALGHSYTAKVTAPTCTAQGYTTHTCSRCSDSYKDTYTNATGHSYTSKVTTAATCTKAGVKTFTCSKCNHSYTEAIAATGHTEVVDKAVSATCTTAGKTEGSHCSVCNTVIKAQSTIPATGHSYTSKVTTAATCTEAGVKTFTCSKCSHSYTEAIAATGHTEVIDKAVAATCTTAGKTEGSHCSVCNAVIKAQTTIPATGHSYTSKVTTAATCTKAGVKTFTCSKCNHSYTEAIAATGHTEVVDKAVAATCTTAGKTEGSHCSVCNAVIKAQTTVPATGHSYTSKITTEATCTKDGVKTFTCSKCNHSYTEAIAATGHTEVVDKAVAATCTTAGKTEGSHCSVCNAVIKAQTTVPATGHSYSYKSNGNGTHTATCARCNDSYTESHNFENGTCACGDAEITLDESIKILHTLDLASDISVTFAVTKTALSSYDSYYLECVLPEYNGNTRVGTSTVEVQPVVSGNYYYFTLTGITAVRMGDMVEAVLHMSKGEQEYYSKTDSYSVATYAYGMLNSSKDAKMLTLCADLLRYGAEAQAFKGYRTDALVDADMTEVHRSYLSNTNTLTFTATDSYLGDLANPTITWVGKTLDLGSKVGMKFVFNAKNYTGDIASLSMKVTYQGGNGETKTVTVTGIETYNAANKQYSFTFYGLLASELRTIVDVAIYEGDTQLSETLRYSAESYAAKTGNTTLESLTKALFAYSDSAKSFFAK